MLKSIGNNFLLFIFPEHFYSFTFLNFLIIKFTVSGAETCYFEFIRGIFIGGGICLPDLIHQAILLPTLVTGTLLQTCSVVSVGSHTFSGIVLDFVMSSVV